MDPFGRALLTDAAQARDLSLAMPDVTARDVLGAAWDLIDTGAHGLTGRGMKDVGLDRSP
jgi:hypothetical protein